MEIDRKPLLSDFIKEGKRSLPEKAGWQFLESLEFRRRKLSPCFLEEQMVHRLLITVDCLTPTTACLLLNIFSKLKPVNRILCGVKPNNKRPTTTTTTPPPEFRHSHQTKIC